MTLSPVFSAINKIECENSANYVTSLTLANRSEFVKGDQSLDNAIALICTFPVWLKSGHEKEIQEIKWMVLSVHTLVDVYIFFTICSDTLRMD